MSRSVILLFLIAAGLVAQDHFQKGREAYQQGDFQTALRIVRPLAYQGDTRAMVLLGRMLEQGQGVAKDEIQAFAWYYLALEAGDSTVEAAYLIPLEERLGDRGLDAALQRAETLQKELASGVRKVDARTSPRQGITKRSGPARSARRAGDGSGSWINERARAVQLSHPADWRFQPASQDGQIRLTSPTGETLVLWPFFLKQQMSPAGATLLLKRFAGLLNPGFQWQRVESLAPNALRCWGNVHGTTAVSGMTWVSSDGRSAGLVYYLAAPDKQFRQNRALYVNILKTVRLHGSDSAERAGRSKPRIAYRRWQDPAEQAFSLEVPAGWQVRGGLLRRAAVDVVKFVQVHSPDGQIYLFIGDPDIPVFTLPNQISAMSGFQEGSWYSPGYGVRMMVMRFQPGVNFAAAYVQNTFGQRCGGFRISASRDRPDASQQINRILQQYSMPGFQQQLSTGEVRFTCTGSTGRRAGYCFAGTQVMAAYGSGIWTVEYLLGYVAPQRRVHEAETILAHMVASLSVNPAWVRMQQGITGNVSQIVSETGNYISNLISSSYAAQQASQEESARRFSNYIRGTEDVVDPSSGQAYKVESGSNYYWIDAGGTIVGTDLSANPDATRFEQMIRLP